MDKKQFSTHELWPVYNEYYQAFSTACRNTGLKTARNADTYLKGFVFSAVSVCRLGRPGADQDAEQGRLDEWLELLMKEKGFRGAEMLRIIKLTNYIALPKIILEEDYAEADKALSKPGGQEKPEDDKLWNRSWTNFSFNMFGSEPGPEGLYKQYRELMNSLRDRCNGG